VTRLKIEDMAKQHSLLVVDAPVVPFAIAAVVPGAGFDRIARELGADVTIPAHRGANPSVEDLVIGVNATLADRVVLLTNDANVALAAREVVALTSKSVTIVPTRDVVAGLAVQLALAGRDEIPSGDELASAAAGVATAAIFFAGKDSSVDGVMVKKGAPAATIAGRLLASPTLAGVLREAAAALGAAAGGLITLYYGGRQKERDAQRYAAELGESFADVSVEYYFGGQSEIEYWMSRE
jgi:dihydroxyacetone kinase-like predicted kinase